MMRENNVLCCVVLCRPMTVVHNDTHAHEQFLKLSAGLGLVFVRLLRFSILCVSSPL